MAVEAGGSEIQVTLGYIGGGQTGTQGTLIKIIKMKEI